MDPQPIRVLLIQGSPNCVSLSHLCRDDKVTLTTYRKSPMPLGSRGFTIWVRSTNDICAPVKRPLRGTFFAHQWQV